LDLLSEKGRNGREMTLSINSGFQRPEIIVERELNLAVKRLGNVNSDAAVGHPQGVSVRLSEIMVWNSAHSHFFVQCVRNFEITCGK
jgi:hypothetical protein